MMDESPCFDSEPNPLFLLILFPGAMDSVKEDKNFPNWIKYPIEMITDRLHI